MSGFANSLFDAQECGDTVRDVLPDFKVGHWTTIVVWTDLYRLGQHAADADQHAQKLLRRLENYLALAFHRFLAGRGHMIRILLDIFDQRVRRSGVPIELDPLDPFGYASSGHPGFPATLKLDGQYADTVKVRAHIWPPNSTDPNYKLPGGTNSRQGFYFYRKDRLIQGGGWNGMRETEPHSSLARIEIDLAPELDLDVSLDVKKVEIHLPPSLTTSLANSRSKDGVDFKRYMSIADDTYRTRRPTEAELPLIPSDGLPAPLTEFLHEELKLKTTSKHRDLKFVWASLEDDTFFEMDRDTGVIYLNRDFRRQLLHGLPGSSADIPVVKCLLFFVLRDVLSSERMGPKLRENAELLNRVLVAAVKFERTGD